MSGCVTTETTGVGEGAEWQRARTVRAEVAAVFPLIGQVEGGWRSFARCHGLDPEIFYPIGDDENAAAEARSVCSPCPVREACLEHALTRREKHGVWGGLTERERRRILRRRRRSA